MGFEVNEVYRLCGISCDDEYIMNCLKLFLKMKIVDAIMQRMWHFSGNLEVSL